MSRARQDLGRRGEAVARARLETLGYVVVAENYRSRAGEIDLVTKRDGAIVFVEVRARSGPYMGLPEESITPTKRSHLVATAQEYLQEHRAQHRQWRIDLVAVEFHRGRPPVVRIIENAIEL